MRRLGLAAAYAWRHARLAWRRPRPPVPPATIPAPAFPVDVVYTWVDGTDPEWRRALAEALAAAGAIHRESANPSRYRDRGELRFSLRSLAAYAPWVRHVYLVTAGHVPPWLDAGDRLTVVPHDHLLPADALPTFNSHAIESRLHHIDGLSEHFLYFNDDFFLGRPVPPTAFFTGDGVALAFPDPAAPIPPGPATPGDRPVDAAAKNVRDALAGAGVVTPTHKLRHAPYALRRSVMAEMEERFAPDFGRTARSRLRSPTDLSVVSCMAPWYAVGTGAGAPAELDALYVNVATRWSRLQMRELLARRDHDTFCLNETDLPPAHEGRVDRHVGRFLEAYFPRPGPFERSGA